MDRLRRVVALVLLACCAALPALGQGVAERHPRLGLALSRPRDYAPLPVRPSEPTRVLAYLEGEGDAGTLDVHVVPESGFDDLIAGGLGATELREERAGRARYGYAVRRWSGELRDGRAVFVHAWIGEGRAVVLAGAAPAERFPEERRGFETVVASVRLFAPDAFGGERARLERLYSAGRWRGVAQRIEARLALLEGWQAYDSEHFLVVAHGLDVPFVNALIARVEAARRAYARLFPTEEAQDSVSTVRICHDRGEFLAYGGDPDSLGYWSPRDEELVLFDARAWEAELPGDQPDTQAVIVHEGFHQYCHDALDGLPPHSWLDEGLAEYFAPVDLARPGVGAAPLNVWRLPIVKRAVDEGQDRPWQQVVALDQDAFYADANLLYAQAWSMVHFLLESPVAARHPRWKSLVPEYLRALRAAWAHEERRGVDRAAAVDRARKAALEHAFADVDWHELQAAWRAYVRGLEVAELAQGR